MTVERERERIKERRRVERRRVERRGRKNRRRETEYCTGRSIVTCI